METNEYEELPKENLVSLLTERDREIEKLQLLIIQANKSRFGKKSEKLSSDDRQGLLFSFEAPGPIAVETISVVPEHTRTVHKKGRKPLPDNLPRNRIEHPPEETVCSCCKEPLVKIGEDITEELDYSPATFVLNEHVRVRLACSRCKGNGVETSKLPETVQPLERARPGSGLLASIIINKYVDHLPLYRQEQMFLRAGIEIPRQRMCDRVMKVADLLYPLWKELKQEILLNPYVQADETTIKVQDPDKENEGLFTGYFWSLHKPPNLAYFEYFPSRAGEAAKELLKDFKGTIQTDLYAGYNKVLLPGEVIRIACLAHVRRKFIEVEKTAKSECTKVLELISRLYQNEAKWKNADSQERLNLRQQHSVPVLSELHEYLSMLQVRTLPKAPLMEAISYALIQWEQVKAIFSDGNYQLDNNAIERQIRLIALGRKNYLFAGSHDGARAAATFYSLLGTCKLNKVNQFTWLSDVISKLKTINRSNAKQLLPHIWKN